MADRGTGGSARKTAKKPSGVPARRGKRGAGHWAGRIGRYAGIVVLALLLIGMLAGYLFYANTKLPNPNGDFSTQTTSLYYRDGTTKLGDLSIQNRTVVGYDQIAQPMKDAVVAAEDRTFWTNRGISPRGMTRAVWAILRGGDVQGGSTITQQYIKLRYLTSERTMTRKLNELALAVKMNNQMSKPDILGGYLNTIYFGRGAYGAEKGAETYFGVQAKDLSVPQAAVLAAMINNPSIYDPELDADNRARLQDRYNYVLDGMLEMGTISQAEHDQDYGKLPEIRPIQQPDTYGGPKGFLMTMAENELMANGFTSAQINGGGLNITTTFDAAAQAAAEQVAQKYTAQAAQNAPTPQDPANLHVGLASVQVGSGELLALYGGPDYVASQFNWGTIPRPAASTFKAWTLLAALRQGFSLNTVLNGSTFTPPGDTMPVSNDSHVNYGKVTLAKATAYSMNTAYTDLVGKMANGPASVVKAANDAGVPSGPGWDLNNRIALGTAEVSPVSNATGFATVANDGSYVATHVIKEVRDSSGKVLYSASVPANQTVENAVARTAQNALEGVVTSGTGTTAKKLNRDVIAKTGTAGVGNATVSAWFVGATKQVSTAVMFVAGDGSADLNPYRGPGYASFSSGEYPAQAWLDYMQVATQGQPVEKFNTLKAVPGVTTSEPVSTPPPEPSKSAAPPSTSSEMPTDQPTQPIQPPTSKEPKPSPTPTPPALPPSTSSTSTSTSTTKGIVPVPVGGGTPGNGANG